VAPDLSSRLLALDYREVSLRESGSTEEADAALDQLRRAAAHHQALCPAHAAAVEAETTKRGGRQQSQRRVQGAVTTAQLDSAKEHPQLPAGTEVGGEEGASPDVGRRRAKRARRQSMDAGDNQSPSSRDGGHGEKSDEESPPLRRDSAPPPQGAQAPAEAPLPPLLAAALRSGTGRHVPTLHLTSPSPLPALAVARALASHPHVPCASLGAAPSSPAKDVTGAFLVHLRLRECMLTPLAIKLLCAAGARNALARVRDLDLSGNMLSGLEASIDELCTLCGHGTAAGALPGTGNGDNCEEGSDAFTRGLHTLTLEDCALARLPNPAGIALANLEALTASRNPLTRGAGKLGVLETRRGPVRLARLVLAACALEADDIRRLGESAPFLSFLTYLDLSSNPGIRASEGHDALLAHLLPQPLAAEVRCNDS